MGQDTLSSDPIHPVWLGALLLESQGQRKTTGPPQGEVTGLLHAARTLFREENGKQNAHERRGMETPGTLAS